MPRRLRDLVLVGEASEGDQRAHPLLGLGVGEDVGASGVRCNETRRERIHPDPVRRPLAGERLGERHEPRLRRRRMCDARCPSPGIGGDEVQDDAAAAARDRLPRQSLRTEERAVQRALDNGAEAVGREVDRRAEEVASVVDENVEVARGVEQMRDRVGIAHVASMCRAQAAFIHEDAAGRVDTARVSRREHDVVAGAREATGDCETDSTPSARHEDPPRTRAHAAAGTPRAARARAPVKIRVACARRKNE